MIDDSAIFHADKNYDPGKAHEYYLRTRHLKGRRTGSQDTGGGGSSSGGAPPSSTHPSTSSASETAQKRLDAMNARLDHLKEVLSKLLEAAKKRSGITTPSSTDKAASSKSGGGKDASKLSPAEKAAKAKADHERYLKEHKNDPKTSSVEAQIAAVQKQIAEVKAQIKEAVAKARDTSTSQTA